MAKIIDVGSYVVDLTSRTPHFPKPGETVFAGPFSMGHGGKGSNQAVAAARLGASVTMVTKVGKDLFGDHALEHFRKENIRDDYVLRDEHESTGAALIGIDDTGENMIIVAPGACGTMTEEDVYRAEREFQKVDMVLTQLETSMEAVEATVELARTFAKPIVLNPAPFQPVSDRLLKHITYITPNETEAEQLTGVQVVDEESARMAARILVEKGVTTVIITLGKRGCYVYDSEKGGRLIQGCSINVCDTTGAGDAFTGAFTTYVADGLAIDEAAYRANMVAALSVTRQGTAKSMSTTAELEAFMAKMSQE